MGLRDPTQTHHTRQAPLEECPARRRALYLTTYNTQQTNIPTVGRIRTYNPSKRAALDPAATGNGLLL